uniref:DNA mismatch repair endonuclease MutL n=1 Tax=Acetatifactor sp. TaxID=1872090 RepID=UPI0040561250
MPQIHILDSETIDKIAAGEVVERPASVVKELVENAVDAGATAITVEAKDGGIEFIRVTDNGSGMDAKQIRTAFLRHATSKIENADDLARISSLGFRGEALSSISAVSKVELITKTRDSLTGCRIVMEGAVEKSFDEIGAPDGTTFIMRNLFFNTPVRRKFLKQPATEGGYIADLMEHLALSRPDISFKFVLGNQTRFHTSGNGDLREVIYRIYGREVASALVPIQVERHGIRIEGFLGKPILVRSNRNFEIYYINGRFIKSNVIAKAIEEGYKEYLMQHKFPLCVLHIKMDPQNVDVNVHPTKMDVRFSNPMAFCNMMSEAVREVLRNREMIPDATLTDDKTEQKAEKEARKEAQKIRTPEPFEQKREAVYRVMEETRYHTDVPKQNDFKQNPVWSRVFADKEEQEIYTAEIKTAESVASTSEAKLPVERMQVESIQEEEDFFVEVPVLEEEEIPRHEKTSANNSNDNTESVEVERLGGQNINEDIVTSSEQMNLFEEKLLSMENRSRYRIIGQVFDTYWLIQFEEKLFIIDQHAAHEKVKYERLMNQYHEKQVVSQNLMPPVIVSLSGQEEAVLKEHEETFAALGFEVEAFGGTEYALRSVPVDLYGCDEKEMFLEVLDELCEGGRSNVRVVEEKIASMSCKAAVKGNNRLSYEEAERLIDELLTLENPYNCPHGRPTIITMSKMEMEKKFKRIV